MLVIISRIAVPVHGASDLLFWQLIVNELQTRVCGQNKTPELACNPIHIKEKRKKNKKNQDKWMIHPPRKLIHEPPSSAAGNTGEKKENLNTHPSSSTSLEPEIVSINNTTHEGKDFTSTDVLTWQLICCLPCSFAFFPWYCCLWKDAWTPTGSWGKLAPRSRGGSTLGSAQHMGPLHLRASRHF